MPKQIKGRSRSAKQPQQRRRLSPAIRKAQITQSAARLVVRQGYLPLPIEQVAANSGVSKALFYTYFADQYALFNGLLERELTALLDGGLDIASQIQDLEQATGLCCTLYFEHVARYGPLLHILMSDRYMAGHAERRVLALRNTILQRLAHRAREALGLSKTEALAAIEMMIAIPEEAGRLVFTQELDMTTGRELCRTLAASSLRALRAPNDVLVGLVGAHDVT